MRSTAPAFAPVMASKPTKVRDFFMPNIIRAMVIFVPNFSGEFASVFPLVSAFEIQEQTNKQKRNICDESEYRAKRRFDFSEYTEECCSSSFEFDTFTFVSATVRLE